MKKKFFKRGIGIVMSLMLVCSLLPATAMADEGDINTLASGTVLTSAGGTLASGEYYLDEDITLEEDIIILSGRDITIDLNGHTLKGTGSNSVITNIGTFTLTDSSGNNSGELTGPTDEEDGVSNGGGVYNGGTFTMTGGKICNNTVSSYGYGGGVYNYNGTFTMNGGEICNNESSPYGGGVYNYNGTFTMNGGEICNNAVSAYAYGGGVYNYNGTFALNGGKICNNESSTYGGGVYNNGGTITMTGGEISGNSAEYGGGVANMGNGTFTMTAVEINDNSADVGGGGVYSYGTFEMVAAEIHDNSSSVGGGVTTGGTFTMTDSVISDNTATTGGGICNYSIVIITGSEIRGNVLGTYGSGGGVYNNGGTFTMTDSVISDNTIATGGTGGGVYNYNGTFTMADSVIGGNTMASSGTGGGVYNSRSTFTMTDSVINGNTLGQYGYGGGVYNNIATFTMTDSVISDNTISASGYGGGIYNFAMMESEFAFSGKTVISGNKSDTADSNVYLRYSDDYPESSLIMLDGALTEGSSVGITTQIKPSADDPVQITKAESDTNYYESSAQYFFSDAGYSVRANESGHYLELYEEHSYDYDNITWTWARDYSSATATVQCTICGDRQTVDANITTQETEPTCTEDGAVVYTATADFAEIGGGIYTDTRTADIPATGHSYDYNDITWIWSSDYDSATATVKCTICGAEYMVDATVTTQVFSPTCTAEGETIYTARASFSVVGGGTYTDTKTRYIPATGHSYDYDNITWIWSSDYNSATATVKCTICGEEYTVEADITFTEITPAPPNFSGAIVYTATADFNDVGGGIYTDTKTVSMSTTGGTGGTGGTTSTPTVKKDSDGKWYYYDKNGNKDTSYTGFAENSNGKWYVESGVVTFSRNDVIKDTDGDIGTAGTWYYVVGSKVQTSYTGVANYKNSNGWWYIANGKVDFSANTVAKNNNGWWYVTGGKVDFNHNGVDKNSNGWWYIVGGKVQFNYTGVGNYKNSNGWWYVKGGKVDFSANTVAKNNNGWWLVEGGKVNFGYTGVANYKNANGWWYVKNGKVDFSYTGRAKNKNGTWNVVNGKVRF